MSSPLGGVSVVVAGAGLAGLTAARDLVAMGASVTVVDARDRVGGRVATVRDGWVGGQRAEAGADLIDDDHRAVRTLAEQLQLRLVRVLRGGWAFATADLQGKVRISRDNVAKRWARLGRQLTDLERRSSLAEGRPDSPIVADIARRSVAQWLAETGADSELQETAAGLAGFFLADPDELSLYDLLDQVGGDSMPRAVYRIEGGNDRLATALALLLGDRIRLNSELIAVSHRGRSVRASIRRGRDTAQLTGDYFVFALPATLVRRVPITPALPAAQHDAINALRYGRVTRSLLQFSHRFWRAPARPRAFGSAQPFGAVWDGNEEQRGKPGILSLTAAGRAADATREAVSLGGIGTVVNWLDWLGSSRASLGAFRQIAWDADPWSRGGYAYLDPSFPPELQPWLARPCGRLFFAGEHTSLKWRGYMNGAVESGHRVAAEIEAVHRSGALVEGR
jgi:monoamine oxidase